MDLQPILSNASVMLKDMPASEAGKVEVGNVCHVGDVAMFDQGLLAPAAKTKSATSTMSAMTAMSVMSA